MQHTKYEGKKAFVIGEAISVKSTFKSWFSFQSRIGLYSE